MVVTPLLSDRQDVFTLLRPIAEHMFPIVQGEKVLAWGVVEGFMMKSPPAGQTSLQNYP